ncbi:MAG TPA: polyphosphate kinase 2 family protein [Clostridiales bacterium]|nr:polyphosphate kinase 2 family protein [Clostridiales bacterium]
MTPLKKYCVDGSKKIKLSDFSTTPDVSKKLKDEIVQKMEENQKQIALLQDKLYSESKESVVVVLQAMDAAGKDGTVKHVMNGLNPQGVDVYSFKVPSSEEAAHDFLWRCSKNLPSRGKIAIFNRSYYEDVLVVKVHKLYKSYKMADRCLGDDIIEKRYKQIRNFEDYVYDNSYRVIKIFLNLSKDEQKKRFLERIDLKIKNWKFSASDVKEREYWDDYQQAYEDAINATSTNDSPWYIIPADKKWYARYLVSQVLLETLQTINPKYPEMPESERKLLTQDKEKLMNEE